MNLIKSFCKYLSSITTIDEIYLYLILATSIVIILFIGLRKLGNIIIRKKMSGRREYLVSQTYLIILNIFEVLLLLFIWDDYIKSLMTLISVISAAMTIALREIILNFYLKTLLLLLFLYQASQLIFLTLLAKYF